MPSVIQNTTSEHLSWRSSAHAPRSEGYALFWRHGQDDRFTIRPARDTLSEGGWKVTSYDPVIPEHVLSLSLNGRPTTTDGAPPSRPPASTRRRRTPAGRGRTTPTSRGVYTELAPFPSMTNWTAFMNGLEAGEFRGDATTGQGADARQAAVFIHDFVSDHLPVTVTFETA